MDCNPDSWSPHLGLSSVYPWLKRQKQPVTPAEKRATPTNRVVADIRRPALHLVLC